jgi:SAM-dependent methyltransferase
MPQTPTSETRELPVLWGDGSRHDQAALDAYDAGERVLIPDGSVIRNDGSCEPPSIYATPKTGIALKDCFFYHSIDLPGHGFTRGHWDLRPNIREYLGGVDFHGKHVLEIGPASGFITAHMDKQGAEVVSVEQPESAVWDFVPYHVRNEEVWKPIIEAKRRNNQMLKNSFWLTHEAMGLKSKVYYGKADALPDELGTFDVSVIALVLTHMRDPVATIASCAGRTRERLIIVERLHATDKNAPAMQLIPDRENKRHDSWWYFSEQFFRQLLTLMGFSKITFSNIACDVNGKPYPVTAIVAEW